MHLSRITRAFTLLRVSVLETKPGRQHEWSLLLTRGVGARAWSWPVRSSAVVRRGGSSPVNRKQRFNGNASIYRSQQRSDIQNCSTATHLKDICLVKKYRAVCSLWDQGSTVRTRWWPECFRPVQSTVTCPVWPEVLINSTLYLQRSHTIYVFLKSPEYHFCSCKCYHCTVIYISNKLAWPFFY